MGTEDFQIGTYDQMERTVKITKYKEIVRRQGGLQRYAMQIDDGRSFLVDTYSEDGDITIWVYDIEGNAVGGSDEMLLIALWKEHRANAEREKRIQILKDAFHHGKCT